MMKFDLLYQCNLEYFLQTFVAMYEKIFSQFQASEGKVKQYHHLATQSFLHIILEKKPQVTLIYFNQLCSSLEDNANYLFAFL